MHLPNPLNSVEQKYSFYDIITIPGTSYESKPTVNSVNVYYLIGGESFIQV